MDKTKIEWADSTWSPFRGCTRISEGCRNCYAEAIAGRFSGPGMPYEGVVRIGESGARWTGDVRLVESVLDQPLRWKRPRRIFVNSMSDTFHPAVTTAMLERVYDVMARAPQHTFMVLTKRPARMRLWTNELSRNLHREHVLPNVWVGTSIENQAAADDRLDDLVNTRAALRFLSVEPLLGPVDLSAGLRTDKTGLVIVGGESGSGARPCGTDWIREVIDQCRRFDVPAFVKQLGSNPAGDVGCSRITRKGGDMNEWPEDLRVREEPKGCER